MTAGCGTENKHVGRTMLDRPDGPGRGLADWGSRGREFKSPRPDGESEKEQVSLGIQKG